MGECAYFFKAQFADDKAARKACLMLTDFFNQARKAYEFYQDGKAAKDSKIFWKEFETKFPLVFEYVQIIPEYVKGNREPQVLAGHLDFGQDDNEPNIEGSVVGYCAEVWHMANWGPLCDFAEKKLGAIKAVGDTEESGCGSLDSLQLYDYETIVDELMKHDELFALLVGIHDDLDAMIDFKIKNSKKGAHRGKKTYGKKS